MLAIPRIRPGDQAPVEPFFPAARLVAGDEQDGLSIRIKGEGHPPDTLICCEPEFLHVREVRAFQGIHVGPSQLGPEGLKQLGLRKKLILDGFRKALKLRIKRFMEENDPIQI